MKAALLFALLCSVGTAQNLVDQDISYGRSIHSRVISASQLTGSGVTYEQLQAVFKTLAETSVVRSGPALPYDLTFLSGTPNAYSSPGGHVYLTTGLLTATGSQDGQLAYAMAHELAHCIEQHQIKKYLRRVEYARMINWYDVRIRYGDKHAQWEELAYVAAQRMLEGKISRDEENRADALGLIIAAEAGYHPDYAFHLVNAFRNVAPDHSKFVTFFASDHPRWVTREAKIVQNYSTAMDVFSSKWLLTSNSPGGVPPPLERTATAKATNMKPPKGETSNMHATPSAAFSSSSPVADHNGLSPVTFTSNPPGALVSISGMFIGRTPVTSPF